MQNDIRPVSTISAWEVFIAMQWKLLMRVGFGQPTKGPYAELHTLDQSVRFLASFNVKMDER